MRTVLLSLLFITSAAWANSDLEKNQMRHQAVVYCQQLDAAERAECGHELALETLELSHQEGFFVHLLYKKALKDCVVGSNGPPNLDTPSPELDLCAVDGVLASLVKTYESKILLSHQKLELVESCINLPEHSSSPHQNSFLDKLLARSKSAEPRTKWDCLYRRIYLSDLFFNRIEKLSFDKKYQVHYSVCEKENSTGERSEKEIKECAAMNSLNSLKALFSESY